MKHLIIFINYTQSRIQNPVYRQFSMTPLSERNATLLFLSKPLDERELMYEVGMLRRKDKIPSPVTFHLCATLDTPSTGTLLAQTLTLIRRQFADSTMLAYCQLPNLDKCNNSQLNAAWKSLVTINNTVTDYQDIHFLTTCFLYSDDTQQSLAHFLYDYTQYSDIQKLVADRCVKETEKTDFPSFFSTFSSFGLKYPDEDIRFHLQLHYLQSILRFTQPDINPVSMDVCHEQALSIMNQLPFSLEQICLQESEFIQLDDSNRPWDEPAAYWENALSLALQGIKDLPHEDWLNQLQTRLEVLFQRRFREVGVEYFFSYEQKKIASYNQILLAGLKQQLLNVMLSNPFPPETQKDIVRAIVNQLQQRVLQVEQASQQANLQVKQLKSSLEEMKQRWSRLGLFDRLRGKDNDLLIVFKEELLRYFNLRTVFPGCQFATQLLNELIPQVSAISEGTEQLTAICRDTLNIIDRNLEESDPSSLCSIFPSETIAQAGEAIRTDQEHLLKQYQRLLKIFYTSHSIIDGEDLLQRMRALYVDDINRYLSQRISDGTMSAVLDLNVAERLSALCNGKGGLNTFIDQLKQNTVLSLLLKTDDDKHDYVLIAPEHADLQEEHIISHSDSSLQMLHLLFGISLTDLDGFSGQRMFVEPSIF